MAISRKLNLSNLVRELADNRERALEILREALSNAKDHGATKVFVRTKREASTDVSLTILDNGEGMNSARLEAFWGVGASSKENSPQPIGYKGHGTKLFFDCRRLVVMTRTSSPGDVWRMSSLDEPKRSAATELEETPAPEAHPLMQELAACGLLSSTGTAISIEGLEASDRSTLVDNRLRIESYCDWFTVIGDVRSGLFDSRSEFHDAIATGNTQALRAQDSRLALIEVQLRVNGEPKYEPLGGSMPVKPFLAGWASDAEKYKSRPELRAFGHRLADVHETTSATGRLRDDLSALRLTGPGDWTSDGGVSAIVRVEGRRRQYETYPEASWQGHPGLYSFEERFGLWLCRDYVPVAHRNDLLRIALERASKHRLKFDLGRFRNWQVFVNDQNLKLTSNRNDFSNLSEREGQIVNHVVEVLERGLKKEKFREWVERLQLAAHERDRDREIQQIQERLDEFKAWLQKPPKNSLVDPLAARGLSLLPEGYSLKMRKPQSEQELFYVYGLVSGRFEVPVHVVDYDASEGVDAIGLVRTPQLVPNKTHARVELKLRVEPGVPIHHFFEAIDLILCWDVVGLGDIYEETSASIGKLRRRAKPVLTPALDTHEIVHETSAGAERIIPVVEVSKLFS